MPRHPRLTDLPMAELKTKPNNASVAAFLKSIEDEQSRKDCRELSSLMKTVTGKRPKMWGTSIVGFGTYRYKYASGREGEWPLVGFSPRKRNLTLYIMSGFDDYDSLLEALGKYKTGKSCLYINKLEDVDLLTLRELVRQSAAHVVETNR